MNQRKDEMKARELTEIVRQGIDEPSTLGRLACNLKDRDGRAKQKHHDGRTLEVMWNERPDFWRCTIFLSAETDDCLAQVDIHNDSTVRVETWEPCSITIDPGEGILVLHRIRKP
jgi:hypothetical protein